jgi:core-2/I-Branching enzyme
MTSVVYVVLSHINPPQVARLIRVLRTGSSTSEIVLHHDESSTHFDPSLLDGIGNVHLLAHRPIAWGMFSSVETVLRAMRWSLEHTGFDWLVLLSGQDYPIRPLSEIEQFLAITEYDGFLRGFPLQSRPETAGEDLQRYLYRYYRVPTPPGLLRKAAQSRVGGHGASVARRLRDSQPLVSIKGGPSGIYFGVRRFRVPFTDDFRWYRGSAWCTLSSESVRVIDRFAANHPRLMRYFRRMMAADESFVPTVLLNEPGLHLCLDHQRFVRFKGGRQPAWSAAYAPSVTLTLEDADDILSSGKHFARKFDTSLDGRILDLIDERVHAIPGSR